ncbi:hypothetical protein BCR43DRAFT_486959 [Syncephalastrum racemosum]|uniref:Uncharacterized protein n=1 Tax=Syncephalastrum racemosum TaxID=13706 RepID=A0A1X2HPZ3_SYNRA|nr:hypothetical protein BCR43DRAFT_486959 [Syncephalastrum racemosum]
MIRCCSCRIWPFSRSLGSTSSVGENRTDLPRLLPINSCLAVSSSLLPIKASSLSTFTWSWISLSSSSLVFVVPDASSEESCCSNVCRPSRSWLRFF